MIIKDMLLTKNPYSRPGTKMKDIRGIVIHWVANPNSRALGNRNFFENRKYGKNDHGSAHYIIDLDGSIMRCIPENEVAYHCGSKTYTKEALARFKEFPNHHTIGIECTHTDWNGKMTDATYKALVELTADLVKRYKLDPIKDLWLHKTVVGWKDCHRWFVNNPKEWENFKKLVYNEVNKKGGFTVSDLLKMEKEIRQALKIKDASWGKSEIDKGMKNGLLNSKHDPNDLVTMGVFMTVSNRLMDEINQIKNK